MVEKIKRGEEIRGKINKRPGEISQIRMNTPNL